MKKVLVCLIMSISCLVVRAEEFCSNKPFYFAVDYLFWQAQEDQIEYATNIPGGLPNEGFVFASQFQTVDQTFKGGSGVRLSAGYSFCDTWDSVLVWTRFKKCSFGEIQGDTSTSIIANNIFSFGFPFVGSGANSDWCLNFNTLDLEFGNNRVPVKSVTLRPHMGLKWARINQTQTVNYLGLGANANLGKKNNFWGIGPRVGFDIAWDMMRHISLFSEVSGALLYGKFDVETDYNLSTDTIALFPRFVNHKHRVRPTTQFLLGLGWEKPFCKVLIDIRAAYEVQYWWNQWQNLPSPATLPVGVLATGDLMTHGLTLRAGIRF